MRSNIRSNIRSNKISNKQRIRWCAPPLTDSQLHNSIHEFKKKVRFQQGLKLVKRMSIMNMRW